MKTKMSAVQANKHSVSYIYILAMLWLIHPKDFTKGALLKKGIEQYCINRCTTIRCVIVSSQLPTLCIMKIIHLPPSFILASSWVIFRTSTIHIFLKKDNGGCNVIA